MELTRLTKLFSEFPPVATAAWEEKIMADLKGADYEKKLVWKTSEGFDVRPYYRAEDLSGLDHLQSLPGRAPFVRGLRTGNNDWIIRQDFNSADLDTSNAQALDAIAKGAGALGLNAREITTHKQMGQLLAGIDFRKTGLNFIASQSFPLTLELFIYELNHRGAGGDQVCGSINFDPISYLLLHGDFYVNWQHNLEETGYLLTTVQQRIPRFKAITINGHYFQNAGSSLVQELAFSLASACEYLAGLTDRGFGIDDVAPYIQFSLAVGSDYFMEIAKFRAARLLWTRMVEQYRPKREESLKLFIHATTASWNKSIFDPHVNILRTTTEGMSAAIGNADSLTILPFDITYKEPDEISRRIARNQQLILKEESYLNKIIDPAGGAYYVENLTHSIASHAWDLFKIVENRGGMLECIKSGFIQDEVEQSRLRKEKEIACQKIFILGTNQYPNNLETMAEKITLDEKLPHPEGGFASYKTLIPFRGANAFEKIRLATERYVQQGHKRPAVFLFTMGHLAMLRARAGFAANFFGCAGYQIIDNQGFETVGEGVAAALSSKAEIVVICSSDEEYGQIVPAIAENLKKSGNRLQIVVAGYPKEIIELLKSAGVSDFIHIRSNLYDTLMDFQVRLGILK